MLSFSIRPLFIATFFALSSLARAVVLDWDSQTWTAGSLENAYDIDPTAAGNDVTASVTGDVGQLQARDGSQTPAILNTIEGGLIPAQNSLVLALDLANTSQSVTFTLTFSSQYTLGVTDVSFKIFDVDSENVAGSTYQDQIRSIRALSIDGTTLIAPTITISSANVLSGAGVDQMVTGSATAPNAGAGSDAGNITISFGGNAIQSFTFTYGSGPDAPADPTFETIAIHDISFTPVPEMNPAWMAILSCMAAAGLVLRHRVNFRK